MKSKLISLALCCSAFLMWSLNAHAFMAMPTLDVYCPNPKLVCLAIHPHIIDPRKPVFDMMSAGGNTVENTEQVIETLQAGLQLAEKTKKLQKWSQTASDLKRNLHEFEMPKMEDFVKGTESAVDVYKGKAKGIISGALNFKESKNTSKAVMDAVVVANPLTAAQRKEVEERKDAFIQQSALDIVARTLYYKSELKQLKDTLTEMQSTSGRADTVGVHEVSIQMKSTNERIQALQEKVLASRLELQSLKNLKNANTVEQKIDATK